MLKIVMILFAFAGSVLLGGGRAAAETYFNGAQILSLCQQAGNQTPAIAKRNLCAFYLLGASDGLVTASLYGRPATDQTPIKPTLCLPDNVALDELTAAFAAYAKAHPERMGDGGSLVAATAFQRRYACGADAGDNTKPDVVFFSAGELLEKCSDASAVVGLYCLYYVIGVSDLYAAMATGAVGSVPAAGFGNQICYPHDMPDDQPKRAFVAYMAAHVNAKDDNAALTAARALRQAFPCR